MVGKFINMYTKIPSKSRTKFGVLHKWKNWTINGNRKQRKNRGIHKAKAYVNSQLKDIERQRI